MVITIAQAAALTIAGNHLAREHELGAFWPKASVFAFCKHVRFVRVEVHRAWPWSKGVPRERVFAEDPARWFAALGGGRKGGKAVAGGGAGAGGQAGAAAEGGGMGFRLHYVRGDIGAQAGVDDRLLAGLVGGGGRWVIESLGATGSDLWEARWEVQDQNDPEQKVWDVTYSRIVTNGPRLATVAPAAAAAGAIEGTATNAGDRARTGERLAALRAELEGALSEIAAFADAQQLPLFAETFRRAMACLDAKTDAGALLDLPAPGFDASASLSLDARQLLAAAQTAWVFGGMGSWNDQGFDTPSVQETYDRLSHALFTSVTRSLAEAASASCPALA